MSGRYRPLPGPSVHPVGLLFNEIITAPHILFRSVMHMLEKVIDMDTGKYSAVSDAILYVVRLSVR